MSNYGDSFNGYERGRAVYGANERVNGEWAVPTRHYPEPMNTERPMRPPPRNTPDFSDRVLHSARKLHDIMESVSESGSKRSFSETDKFVDKLLDRLNLNGTPDDDDDHHVKRAASYENTVKARVNPGAMAALELSLLGQTMYQSRSAREIEQKSYEANQRRAVVAMQQVRMEQKMYAESRDTRLRQSAATAFLQARERRAAAGAAAGAAAAAGWRLVQPQAQGYTYMDE